jgi:hypothetical protein
MTFIGVLLFIVSIIGLVFYPKLKKQNKVEKENFGESDIPDFIVNHLKKLSFIFMGLGVFFILVKFLFMWAEPGYQYLLVRPSGKVDAVMSEGIKWRGLAQVRPWQKHIDVKVIPPKEKDEKDFSDIEGPMTPIPVRFIDQVTATVIVSTRFQIPNDKKSFINMAIEFRSMQNLINNTLIPVVNEQTSNTAYMFAAQDYISGSAQQFRQTLEEQLKTGAYKVEKSAIKDTVYENIDEPRNKRKIREIRTKYNVEKVLGEDGRPIKIPHEITENKIIVSQVVVDDLILEEKFKERLEKQRDESALRQLEQQKIETAKATQQRYIAEGERDKALERATQEKKQVKELITIETSLKKEETQKKLAQIQYETEVINARKKKVKADAEAYEISKKVRAGITPETELKMRLDAEVKKAAEIAKIKLPEVYIGGGSGSSNNILEDLIGADYAKQMLKKTTK